MDAPVTNAHLAGLRELSAAASGWIVFDDDHEEILVPLEEWKQRFKTWPQQ